MVRGPSCALLLLLAWVPVPLATTPAAAAPSETESAVTHPQDDWAGSQIARYESQRSQDDPLSDRDPSSDRAGTPTPNGLDVSSHQGGVDWSGVATQGAKFAYVKATEGSSYVNPDFAQQYQGAYTAGLIRGAYHFATPNTSDGATQADYFADHGGGWSGDGRTLPPAVDLEYNPYGQTCYGMSAAALGTWVRAFVNEIKTRTGRLPMIYTSTRWWAMCMGDVASFGADPLWIARYNDSVGGLPPGWTSQSIWQYANSGTFPGDQDSFNGSMDQLRTLAGGCPATIVNC